MHEPLLAISPLDGRYAARLEALRPWVSEYGLIRARVEVEVLWLIAMAEEDALSDIPPLSAEEKAYLLAIVERFSLEDAKRVKAIEQTTNHDVKAVEYFLRERLQAHPTLSARSEWIHFGCTSEDINNLAYARLIQRLREDVVLPKLAELEAALWDKAEAMRNLPMLARTHGQPASPTTMGKEWAVFALRLRRAKARIAAVEIFGKFNGATGNFQAHRIAYPEAPWPEISRRFVEERLGLVWNPLTTQIEPHDWVAELLDAHARAASVLIDFARDIWGYIALGYFRQKLREHEVGSSTMPHKVNPIDFENAEGNLQIAQGLMRRLSDALPISRWQRDLTDSTTQRNLGVAFGHFVLALDALLRGIGKLEPDAARMREDLDGAWEVLAEAVQTVMRRYRIPGGYERMKALTRGRAIRADELKATIEALPIPDEAKARLLRLTPADYIGDAEKLIELGRRWQR